ncbi:MAG: glycoside hydrolase family 13 protein, partial [Acidimicrobiia bacterium]|nr:glycoside hydrolase family 13 protein [Acidimicrobiia bacterium]
MTPLNKPPAWVADAVFYQIFPDRFSSSKAWPKPANLEAWEAPPTFHGYKGGDLVGVIEQLDWLEHLGINAIYFNPIFASGSNHRYHAWDFYRIDPLLGDDEVFDRLIDECHERGIKVVLDGVFNHTGRGFFQFHDILESGAGSPWTDWYSIYDFPVVAYDTEDPPNYHAWWGLPALPKLNTDNPDVREYLMLVAEHWARRGIDGWRLDVPQEITTPGFWEEFRTRVRSINPDLYIVGEIWDDASDWISRGDRFDATMNYLFAGHTLAFTAGSRVPDKLAA